MGPIKIMETFSKTRRMTCEKSRKRFTILALCRNFGVAESRARAEVIKGCVDALVEKLNCRDDDADLKKKCEVYARKLLDGGEEDYKRYIDAG